MGLQSNYSLCIIIPMFNEERGAEVCIDRVIQVIRKMQFPVKLLIVNDGSTDKTDTILREKKKEYSNLIVVTHEKNKGYGKALQTGIQEAVRQNFHFCIFMDSDLTNDPKYILQFAKLIGEDYDCVKASRYIYGGAVVGVSLFRRLVSIMGNAIASKMFEVGIRDCTNGFRMVRLELLRNAQFKENGFAIILEELYYLKKKHAKFKEIPYTLTSRSNSKSHFHYTLETFMHYFNYAWKAMFV